MTQSDPGLLWYQRIRQHLDALQTPPLDPETENFFHNCYRANRPYLWRNPPWLRFDTNLGALVHQIDDASVQVQVGRSGDPDYEKHADRLRRSMLFPDFVTRMLAGAGNDLYMTAGNGHANTAALRPFWNNQKAEAPPFLRRVDDAFVWLGADTVTPLHHDETNNLMCQVLGRKLVRVFDPDQRPRLDVDVGVHSKLGWVDDATVRRQDLRVRDVWLTPGDVLFLPIGWWHCVRAHGIAMTLVYTNFVWPNFWGRVGEIS